MKKFKILPLVMILLLSLSLLPVSALAVDEPEIDAAAAVVVDAGTGETYYEKNADARVQPASTTKLVTAMLVLEAVDRGEISLADRVTAYDDCQYGMEADSSHANPAITPGEELTVEELLYCAMLVSANEACNILAEYVSGSIGGFVDAMNARAQELGCTGTHFSNTNGLEAGDHYTTAAELAVLARQALASSALRSICATLSYTVSATNAAAERVLRNTNSLLNPESDYYYEYAYGVKTGFFSSAGYCLVSAAELNDIDVICVVLGAPSDGGRFEDTITLYNWTFENYEYRELLNSSETRLTVEVETGTSDSTGVRARDSVSAVLPLDYPLTNIRLQAMLYHEVEGRTLEAPVNAGEVLGEVTVVEVDDDGNVIRTFGSSPLVATTTVEMSRVEYLRSQIDDLFANPVVRRVITVLLVLIAVYLLLVIFYLIQRIRHLRSLRAAKRERARRQTERDAEWLEFPEEDEDDYLPERDETPPLNAPRGQSAEDDDFFDSFFGE